MNETNISNMQFMNRNLNIIWNKLKVNKKLKVTSMLNAHDFENHYSALMKDDKSLSGDQVKIQTKI